jgi:hypothetical protein
MYFTSLNRAAKDKIAQNRASIDTKITTPLLNPNMKQHLLNLGSGLDELSITNNFISFSVVATTKSS